MCRYILYKGVRFFLPDCMGGAVYGLTGCTCSVKRKKSATYMSIIRKIKDLEKRIKILEQTNEK